MTILQIAVQMILRTDEFWGFRFLITQIKINSKNIELIKNGSGMPESIFGKINRLFVMPINPLTICNSQLIKK